jgi:inner membrane protein
LDEYNYPDIQGMRCYADIVASIGHVAVGLLVGRACEARTTKERVITMGLFGGLGLLPDADAALVAAGFEYESQWGHRGFSHSLLFAVTAGAVAYFLARRWGTKPLFTAFLAFLAVASHGLMDSMTYRTRGIPFLWPFTEHRFQLPWRPIPPAPFGEHFISRRGFDVMCIEMIYFLPLTLGALSPSWTVVQGWARRISAWFLKTQAEIRAIAQTSPALAAVKIPVFTPRRAAARVLVVGAVFALSLALAQTTLRDSRPVAWLESAHDETIAVSLQQTPQYRHLH